MTRLSDELVDDLVELFFLAMPGVDGKELRGILNCVLALVEKELRRLDCEDRAACYDLLTKASEN